MCADRRPDAHGLHPLPTWCATFDPFHINLFNHRPYAPDITVTNTLYVAIAIAAAAAAAAALRRAAI